MRVVVVGAGVIGLSVASQLARRGADVLVVDRSGVGAGTSGLTYGWVNANRKEPLHYHGLNAAGLRAHRADARGIGRWFFPHGHLEIATTDEHAGELAGQVERLSGRDYAARAVSVREAAALEPGLPIPADARLIVHYPDEGYCHPALLLAQLRGSVTADGGIIREGEAVTSVRLAASGVVVQAGGEAVTADVAVCATGRWTGRFTAGVHAEQADVQEIPMVETEGRGLATLGFLGVTEPAPAALHGLVTHSRLNLRPDGAGRLILQALELDGAADTANVPGTASPTGDQLLGRLREVVPWLSRVRLTSLGVGQRSLPADGLTVAGWLDPGQRIYAIATHSGITLGPLLGHLGAQEIFGAEAALLGPYRPRRFADRGAAAADAVTAPRTPGSQ